MEEKLSLGHLAALFTVVNWGTTFIATKLLLEAYRGELGDHFYRHQAAAGGLYPH